MAKTRDDIKNGLISCYYIDSNENPVTEKKKEVHKINSLKNIVQLLELPERGNRVRILNKTGMVEVKRLADLKEENQYWVDYESGTGNIFFHPNKQAQTVEIEYDSKGYTIISADRVFTDFDEEGSIPTILGELLRQNKAILEEIFILGGGIQIFYKLQQAIADGNELHPKLVSENTKATSNVTNLTKQNTDATSNITKLTTQNNKADANIPNLTDQNNRADVNIPQLNQLNQTATTKTNELNQAIQDGSLGNFQLKIDNSLTTVSKNIVGGINEVKSSLEESKIELDNKKVDKVEGETLTPNKYTNYEKNKVALIDNKADTVYVDNKVWTMKNMGQDIKTAMTGGSVPVVGEGAVDTNNVRDNSVTFNKRTRLGEKVDLICTREIPNLIFNTVERKLIFSGDTYFYVGKKSYALTQDTVIDLDGTKANNYIFINMDTGEIIALNQINKLSSLSETHAMVATVTFTGAIPSSELLNISMNSDFKLNGEFLNRLGNKSVKTNMVDDKAITSVKKTVLGESCFITLGNPYRIPNVDLINTKLQLFGETFINWRNIRYKLNTDSSDIKEVDFSTVWNDTTASVLICFNIDTKQFEVFPSNKYNEQTENSLLFMCLSKEGNTKELLGITCNFSYTINGKKPGGDDGGEVNEYNLYTPPEIPSGWYKARSDIQGYEAESHYLDTVTLNDIYSVYDNACTLYPDYVVKTNLGKDSTDTYDIFKYEFKPSAKVEGYNLNDRKIPKIFIVTNTHGEEKSSTISMRNFIDDLCNNWRDNPLLEYIRWNVHLIIIPVLNPYGFEKHSRKNGRGVDLNRNSSYRWELAPSDTTSKIYRGESPFSEKETQYVRDVLKSNLDIIAFFDYHMNGTSGTNWKDSFWHYVENINEFKKLVMLSRYDIIKMTVESQKSYNVPLDSGYIGYISYNPNASTMAAYANSEGIPACATIECTRKMVGDTNVYSSNVLKMCTEFIGNKILSVIREFSK